MATKLWLGNDSGNEGDLNVAANWSPSGVPTSGDDVIFTASSQSVTGTLDQWASTGPDSITIDQSYTGLIAAGDYLEANTTSVIIGRHSGPGNPAGSGTINLDLKSAAATVLIENAGTPTSSTAPAINLLLGSASAKVVPRKGKIGVATGAGETSTVGTIETSYRSSVTGDVELYVGSGVTLTTLTQRGGATQLNCAATTINGHAGTLTTQGSGAIGTINNYGATITANSTGTITAWNNYGGSGDLSKSTEARTITTLTVKGGSVKYDPSIVTVTNAVASDGVVTVSGD